MNPYASSTKTHSPPHLSPPHYQSSHQFNSKIPLHKSHSNESHHKFHYHQKSRDQKVKDPNLKLKGVQGFRHKFSTHSRLPNIWIYLKNFLASINKLKSGFCKILLLLNWSNNNLYIFNFYRKTITFLINLTSVHLARINL